MSTLRTGTQSGGDAMGSPQLVGDQKRWIITAKWRYAERVPCPDDEEVEIACIDPTPEKIRDALDWEMVGKVGHDIPVVLYDIEISLLWTIRTSPIKINLDI